MDNEDAAVLFYLAVATILLSVGAAWIFPPAGLITAGVLILTAVGAYLRAVGFFGAPRRPKAPQERRP